MKQLALDIKQYFNLGTNSSGARKDITDPYLVPGSGSGAVAGGGLFTILSTVIKNIYVITGIILLFFIVIGGIGMILNAGNAEKQKQSSNTVTSAVIGYFIMFVAYWIIRIIEIFTDTQILAL